MDNDDNTFALTVVNPPTKTKIAQDQEELPQTVDNQEDKQNKPKNQQINLLYQVLNPQKRVNLKQNGNKSVSVLPKCPPSKAVDKSLQKLPSIVKSPIIKIRSQSTKLYRPIIPTSINNNQTNSRTQSINTHGNQLSSSFYSDKIKPDLSFINKIKEKINRDFDQLYKSQNQQKIINKLKEIERDQFYNEDVQKIQDNIQSNKNQLNSIQWKNKTKRQLLSALNIQLQDIEFNLNNTQEQEIVQKSTEQYNTLKNQLDMCYYQQESLQYMCKIRKIDLEIIQYEHAKKQKAYELLKEELNFNNQFNLIEISNLNLVNKKIYDKELISNEQISKNNEKLDYQLNNEIKQLENTIKQKELQRFDQKLMEEKQQQKKIEKEMQLKRQQENMKVKQQKFNLLKQYAINELKNKQSSFEQIQQIAHSNNNIDNLLNHNSYLISSKEELKSLSQHYLDEIKATQEKIEYLTIKKNQIFVNNNDNIKNEDEHLSNQQLINQLENQLVQSQNQAVNMEKMVKDRDGFLNRICLYISRIIYQIQNRTHAIKDKQIVDQQNLIQQMEKCTQLLEQIHNNIKNKQFSKQKNNNVNSEDIGIKQIKFFQPTRNSSETALDQTEKDLIQLQEPSVDYQTQAKH